MSTQPSFTHKYLPVHATYHGAVDGWESTGIAFEDAGRMRSVLHKLNNHRRAPTPAWVSDDAAVREVITLFIESRARLVSCGNGCVRRAREGTVGERLDRAQARMQEIRPQLENNLRGLCARYMSEHEPKKRKMLAESIENIDTQLRIIERGASICAAVLHFYYKMGMDSVAIAQELHLKPPHVRQLLYRLGCTYKLIEGIRAGTVKMIPYVPRIQHMGLDADNKPVPLCVECGVPCKSRAKYCTRKCLQRAQRKRARAKAKQLNLTPKPEVLKFCSPSCKTHYTEHPLETLKKRFGIDLSELKKTEGESYASYVVYCATLKQVPMPAHVWRLLNGGGR